MMSSVEAVRERLRMVLDPELGVNIVDLGLVYGIDCSEDGTVAVIMTLTTPGCPMHESLASSIEKAIKFAPDVTAVKVNLVWMPPWSPDLMTDFAREQLWGSGE